jgi:hypothetical protein
VIRTAAEQNAAQNTPTPSQPTEANAPALPAAVNTEEDSAMKPKQPPACTFPLAEIKAEESIPEEYTFSEPKVVLTAPQGNIYHIAEWLPDNQQILMTEEIGNSSDSLESIVLYNPVTGESKVYATRPITYQSPAWQPELDAVVYPIMRYFDIDKQNRTYDSTAKRVSSKQEKFNTIGSCSRKTKPTNNRRLSAPYTTCQKNSAND